VTAAALKEALAALAARRFRACDSLRRQGAAGHLLR
jgi:hypothetical protein